MNASLRCSTSTAITTAELEAVTFMEPTAETAEGRTSRQVVRVQKRNRVLD